MDIHVNNKLITIVKLINISISSYKPHFMCMCVCVVIAPEIYSLRRFPVFNTVFLTLVIMLYISFPDLFIYKTAAVCFRPHLLEGGECCIGPKP